MNSRLVCIDELISLSSDSVFSIAKIEWWLLKNHDLFNEIEELESRRFRYFIDGRWVRLPDYLVIRTKEEKFRNIYKRLNDITKYQRLESNCKEEITIFNSISNDVNEVINWLIKNEKLFFVDFGPDYFSEDFKQHVERFLLDINLFDVHVSVDKKEFKYVIEFLNIYDANYWELSEKHEAVEQLGRL